MKVILFTLILLASALNSNAQYIIKTKSMGTFQCNLKSVNNGMVVCRDENNFQKLFPIYEVKNVSLVTNEELLIHEVQTTNGNVFKCRIVARDDNSMYYVNMKKKLTAIDIKQVQFVSGDTTVMRGFVPIP